MKDLGELLEVLADLTEKDDRTEVFLEIKDPPDDCALFQELEEKL
jgi:hypothetical protein